LKYIDAAMRPPAKEAFVIEGYHAVREALLSGRMRVAEVVLSQGADSARKRQIEALAREKAVPVRTEKGTDSSSAGIGYQGFAAVMREFPYADLEDIATGPSRRLIVALDHITDEGNLGAIIRSAAFFNADGILLPKDRSASITPLVFRRSSGGCVHLPIAMVVNLERALKELKDKGLWVIGADGASPLSMNGFDWDRDLVLVMGNEEKGLCRAVRRRCDALVSIPGCGKVGSLNVSVAAGILLAHIRKSA
jgi:23S rRNA (guanosine2251-2'-O)-methyltransferase